MGRRIDPTRHLVAQDRMVKAEWEYNDSLQEYNETFGDYCKYWEIVYRTHEYIKYRAGSYERMFNVKSSEIGKEYVIIKGDSIEIIGDRCVIRDNVTLKFPMEDDSELLSWSYECKNGWYNQCDWVAFMMRALKCKEIEWL